MASASSSVTAPHSGCVYARPKSASGSTRRNATHRRWSASSSASDISGGPLFSSGNSAHNCSSYVLIAGRSSVTPSSSGCTRSCGCRARGGSPGGRSSRRADTASPAGVPTARRRARGCAQASARACRCARAASRRRAESSSAVRSGRPDIAANQDLSWLDQYHGPGRRVSDPPAKSFHHLREIQSPRERLACSRTFCSVAGVLSFGLLMSTPFEARQQPPARVVAAAAAADRRRREAARRPSTSASAACRSSTATSRCTGTSAPARSSSRSRASTPSFSTRPVSPPVSARTTSASTAEPAAARASCRSSASARACCWCSRTSRSDRAARTRSSASRSKTRSRNPCSGDSRSPPRATDTCSSTRPTSCCAT